jgi:CRP/FNR family transcriptional regulator
MADRSTESTAEFLAGIEYFADLTSEELARLADSAEVISVGKGSKLFAEGDPFRGIYIVCSGELKLTMIGLDGREQILYIAREQKVIADGAMLDEGAYPAGASAIKDSELIFFPREKVAEWIESMPGLARGLLRLATRRVSRFVRLIQDLSLKSVQSRLASFLYTLALKQGAEAGESFELTRDLTVETVASQLGTVREEISRMLSLFEQRGILSLSRSNITIHNLEQLETAIYEPLK